MIARLLAAITLSLTASFAGPPDPSIAPLLKPVRAVVNASETGNARLLDGIYTPDAVVVADVAPFTWTGERAGVDWLTCVQGEIGRWKTYGKFTRFETIAHPVSRVQIAGSNAFVSVPLKLIGTQGSRVFRGTATLTITLRRSTDGWKVYSQTWTGEPLTSGRSTLSSV